MVPDIWVFKKVRYLKWSFSRVPVRNTSLINRDGRVCTWRLKLENCLFWNFFFKTGLTARTGSARWITTIVHYSITPCLKPKVRISVALLSAAIQTPSHVEIVKDNFQPRLSSKIVLFIPLFGWFNLSLCSEMMLLKKYLTKWSLAHYLNCFMSIFIGIWIDVKTIDSTQMTIASTQRLEMNLCPI